MYKCKGYIAEQNENTNQNFKCSRCLVTVWGPSRLGGLSIAYFPVSATNVNLSCSPNFEHTNYKLFLPLQCHGTASQYYQSVDQHPDTHEDVWPGKKLKCRLIIEIYS